MSKRRIKIVKSEPVEYLEPRNRKVSFSKTDEYRYFVGHTVKEVAQQLPTTNVTCWKTHYQLTLPVCAVHKFVKQKNHCKKCTLFQEDNHSDQLRTLIKNWEQDEMEENYES